MRYDQVNNVTTAMDILNNDDSYKTSIKKWNAIASLFTDPTSAPGNNWKNRTAYFTLSLLFWTSEPNIADIEFLLYFRCSAAGTVTMKTALAPKKETS